MIEILVGMAGAAFAASMIYLKYFHGVKHGQVDLLARLFGLSVDGDTAQGTWNGRPIEIRIREIGDKQGETLLRLGGVEPRLSLTREPFRLFGRRLPPPGPFLPPSMGAGYHEPKDVVTGDGEFDARIKVKGPIGRCTGILNGELRRFVLAADALGITVADGWMTLRQLHLPREEDDLPAWIRLMGRLADSLADRGKNQPLDNLLDNFRAERDPDVRRVNLACLGAYFPDNPASLEASRTALADPESDWIRLQGAVNLRREGWPALQALADDSGRLDGVRAAALRALGLSLPLDEALPLLYGQLNSAVPALALSAVETLGDLGGTVDDALALDRWAEGRPEKAEARLGREAAAKVRARLEDAEPGRLSFTGDGDEKGEGQLSRTEAERELRSRTE